MLSHTHTHTHTHTQRGGTKAKQADDIPTKTMTDVDDLVLLANRPA